MVNIQHLLHLAKCACVVYITKQEKKTESKRKIEPVLSTYTYSVSWMSVAGTTAHSLQVMKWIQLTEDQKATRSE